MDSMSAFVRGEMNRGNPLMVFDWVKAAKLISENRDSTIRAGLAGDWEYTGGTIWKNGKPAKGYTYLASTWATPEIEIDGCTEDCYVMESVHPDWDADTYFPPEALEILGLTEADIPTDRSMFDDDDD